MHSAHPGLSSPNFHRTLAPFTPTVELPPKHISENNQLTEPKPNDNQLTPLSDVPPTADGKKVLDPLDQLLLSLQAKADAETKEREAQAVKERDLQTPAKSYNIATSSSPFAIANPFASPVFTPEVVKESERAFSAFGLATKLEIEVNDSSSAPEGEHLKTKSVKPINETEPSTEKHGLSDSERLVSNPVVQSPPIAMSRATAAALGIAYVDNEETVSAESPMVKETVAENADGPSQPNDVSLVQVPSSSVSSHENTVKEEETTAKERNDATKEKASSMESKADEKVRGDAKGEAVNAVEAVVKEAKIEHMASVMIEEKVGPVSAPVSVSESLPKNEAEPWVPPAFSGLSNSERIIPPNVSAAVSSPRVEPKQEIVETKEEAKNVIAGKGKPSLPVKGKKEDDSDAAGEAMIVAEMERILNERQSEKTSAEEEKNSGKSNLPVTTAAAADTISLPPPSSSSSSSAAGAEASQDISMLMPGLSVGHDQGNKTGSPIKGKTVLSDKAAYVRYISTKYDDRMAIHAYRQSKLIHEEERQKQKEQEQSKQEGQSRNRKNSRGRGSRTCSSQSPLKKGRALHLGGGAVGYDVNVLALAGL